MSVSIDTIMDRWLLGHIKFRDNKSVWGSSNLLESWTLNPLACKLDGWILINGDRCCRGGPAGHIHYNNRLQYNLDKKQVKFITVPFSALRGPLGFSDFKYNLLDLKVIDSQKDSWIKDQVSGKETHQIGGSLIRYEDRYLLSTMDVTQRLMLYSLIELNESVGSLNEAYLSLIPDPVKEVVGSDLKTHPETFLTYKVKKHPWCSDCNTNRTHEVHTRELVNRCVYNNGVIRQGEWFFVPITEDPPGEVRKDYSLVNRAGRNNHILTHGKVDNLGNVFSKGMVRHRNKEHSPVYLKNWYQVLENNAKQSWSAGGYVD